MQPNGVPEGTPEKVNRVLNPPLPAFSSSQCPSSDDTGLCDHDRTRLYLTSSGGSSNKGSPVTLGRVWVCGVLDSTVNSGVFTADCGIVKR